MRRTAVPLALAALALLVATPAYGFAHDRVTQPWLHTALDVLSLAVVTAPLWTAYLWGGRRRGLLVALVAVVQLPVAVVAFTPILAPVPHALALTAALLLTTGAILAVRHTAVSTTEPVS
ncbi:MAG: hypothetical protein ACRDT6_04130 [Micromonosporaceae bacterium]